jgi:hypothetical protein
MSSDSEESDVTADNEERGTSGEAEEVFGDFVEPQESNDGGLLTKDVMEEEQQHARDELRTGVNGTSFVRHAPREHTEEGTDDGTELGSELPVRQRAQVPGSPESTSTPDDTPSIQVSPQDPV